MPLKPNVLKIDTYLVSAVSVDTTAGGTEILAKNNLRAEAVLFNNGANTIFVGPSGVTTATGLPMAAGAAFTLQGQAALFGIVAAASEEMRLLIGEDD